MTEATPFTIGVDAVCTDGFCGEVTRVIVDPVARAVTHLVVEPKHRSGLGKLVPVELIDATADEVRIRCRLAEFDEMTAAEETQFLPGSNGEHGGYGTGHALSWPYYSLGNLGIGGAMGMGVGSTFDPIVYDTLPLGEVAVRRGDTVHATDGDIGRVQGLVIDPRNHHVTHVLLQEGHLRGRKEVAIPISSVTRVDDGIELNITKQAVQDLPPVDLDHPGQ